MGNKKLFVFLHGFGFDKNNNKESIDLFKKEFPNWDFVGFDALYPSLRERGGFSWYKKNDDGSVNISSFQKSVSFLRENITKELSKRNLKWSDLIICGRSQGAYTSMYIGLNSKKKCHLIISLCGFIDNSVIEEVKSNPNIVRFEAGKDEVLGNRINTYGLFCDKNITYNYILDKKSDHDNLSEKGIYKIIEYIKKS